MGKAVGACTGECFGVCAVLGVFALWNWKTVMPEGAGTWRHKGMTLVQQLSLPVYSVVCCVWSLLCLERTKQVHPILSQENVLSDNFMFEAKAPVFLFLLSFMIMVRQKWHTGKIEHFPSHTLTHSNSVRPLCDVVLLPRDRCTLARL